MNLLGKYWIKRIFWGLALIIGAWYAFFALPSRLFQTPYATLLLDRNNRLLGASIASDGQWRFPGFLSFDPLSRTAFFACSHATVYENRKGGRLGAMNI